MSTNDDLHAAIMNLPCKFEAAWQTPAPSDWIEGYVNGHRDTRHAAAELAAAASSIQEERVKRLREALDEILGVEICSPEGGHEEVAEIHCIARAALKETE
jgi:hypothetical protein